MAISEFGAMHGQWMGREEGEGKTSDGDRRDWRGASLDILCIFFIVKYRNRNFWYSKYPAYVIHIYYIYTHKQLLALSHLRRLFFLGAPNIGPLTYLGQVGRNPPGNPAGEKKVPPEVVFLFWHRKNWATTKKRFGTLKETYTLKSWSSLDFELNNVFHFKNISPTPIFQDFS